MPHTEQSDTARRAPVQVRQYRGDSAPSVPWAVHVRAWQAYAALGHGDQSAERIAERGGFGWQEMVLMLAERNPWRGGAPMTPDQRARFARYREGSTS